MNKEIEPYLRNYTENLDNSKISKALIYSLEGGKCIRGYIVKIIMESFQSDIFWEPIVAIELLQAATLIIDDLPSMDNDTYRRNKLSTFVVFGENETILTSFFYGIRIIKNNEF